MIRWLLLIRRAFLLFALVVFSGFASADMYWSYTGSGFSGQGGTPVDSFLNYLDKKGYNHSGSEYCLPLDGPDDTSTPCYARDTSTSPSGTAVRYGGTVCTAPKVYDYQYGGCKAPDNPCDIKTGTSSPFAKSGSFNDGYYAESGGYGAPAQDGCFGGCTASTVDQKCVGNLKTSTYKCRGTMYYTGAQCTTSPAPEVDETTDTSRPDPETYKDETPCNYSTGPTGSLVCTSSKTEGTEGQNCGTVNGVKTCIDTKPTQNGIEISTKVDTTTNADGSTTTTKTDTATVTSCAGIGQCTSTTTTTTTTTDTDGSGTVTSVSGSCTGDQCPDKNTNPDGDGDGFGDCIGDDCGGGGGASVETPELDDEVPTYSESMIAFIDHVQAIDFIEAARNVTIPAGGGSCSIPPLHIWGGSINFDTFCAGIPTVLGPLSYLILAMWGWWALRIVLSA